VGANDVLVRLVAAARHDPAAQLATWWGERYCKAILGEVVRPDGLGVWHEAGGSVTFCLEYDRGSEPLGRLGAKAVDYARLESGWAVPFWVLVVVHGPRREAGARAALSGEGLAIANHHPTRCPPADRRGVGTPRGRGDPASPRRPGRQAPACRLDRPHGRGGPLPPSHRGGELTEKDLQPDTEGALMGGS